MSAVWVMRNPTGHVHVITECDPTGGDPLAFGWTLTRETLLTHAQAAVLEAAKAQAKAADAIRTHRCIEELPCSHDREHIAACARTEAAVTTLRAQEGE